GPETAAGTRGGTRGGTREGTREGTRGGRCAVWDLLITGAAGGTAVAVAGERIAWAGPADALPAGARAREVWRAGGRVVTPGLVDCHTHLVFGGDRSSEWEQRLAGASYEAIARAGGGIQATVRATRAATNSDL